MRTSIDNKIFELLKKRRRNYVSSKNIRFSLLNFYTVSVLFYFIFSMKNYFPIFAWKSLNKSFLFFCNYPSFLSFIHIRNPQSSRVLSFTRYNFFNLNPLIFASPCLKLNVCYFIKGRIIQIILELHINVFSVFWILWIWETVRFDEDSVHKWPRDSLEWHLRL